MKKSSQIVLIFLLIICVNKLYATQISHIQGDTTICRYPNIKPSFPGGKNALNKFLAKKLKWPDQDLDVRGKVLISFIVEKDGELTHFKIFKKLYPSLDAEALRVEKLMPRWHPGILNGKTVRCIAYLPVIFQISD